MRLDSKIKVRRGQSVIKRAITVIFILFYSQFLFQQSFNGVLLDRATRLPVNNALVVLKGELSSTTTNSNGAFKINIPLKVKEPVLVFTLLGYSSAEYPVKKMLNDTFYISQKNFELNEVVISAQKKVILNKKKQDIVLDFELLHEDMVLLKAGNDKNFLELTDEYGENKAIRVVDKYTEAIDYDCLGNLQMKNKDSVWQVFYDFVNLRLLSPVHAKTFNKVMGNCVCVCDSNYYFQAMSYRNLRKEFFYYNENQKGLKHPLVCFADTNKIKSFETDYSLQYFLQVRADTKLQQYGVPVSELKQNIELYREQLQLPWDYVQWLGCVEAQMEKTDSTLYVFNFTDSLIHFVNKKNEINTLCAFGVMKNKYLLHKVYVDRQNQETWLAKFYDSKLTLIRFDVNTGKETARSEIPNTPYLPKKIIISGRKAFFIQKNLVDEQVYKVIKFYLD
ncbi:MAG: carboxypeptidase-like regulatory domain-containing protein [Bacteroidia bacterium]|nr:carboxypeptidase-like regulatory domain-containing protein [Bacteroidia bacterium]